MASPTNTKLGYKEAITNIRLGWIMLRRTNKQLTAPGSNPIKLYTAVIYVFCSKLECVSDKSLQPRLMFAGKARSLPECSTFKVLRSTLGSWH